MGTGEPSRKKQKNKFRALLGRKVGRKEKSKKKKKELKSFLLASLSAAFLFSSDVPVLENFVLYTTEAKSNFINPRSEHVGSYLNKRFRSQLNFEGKVFG